MLSAYKQCSALEERPKPNIISHDSDRSASVRETPARHRRVWRSFRASDFELRRLSRLNLESWILRVILADVGGAIASSLLIFHLYADPLNYDRTQMWAGLIGFLITWALAAHSLQLYTQQVAFGGRARLFRRVFATLLVAFGLILAFAFGVRLLNGVSRLWLTGWAMSVACWLMLVRLMFNHFLAAAMRRGLCVDRGVVLCASLPTGKRFATAIERESRGQVKVAATALLPGQFRNAIARCARGRHSRRLRGPGLFGGLSGPPEGSQHGFGAPCAT